MWSSEEKRLFLTLQWGGSWGFVSCINVPTCPSFPIIKACIQKPFLTSAVASLPFPLPAQDPKGQCRETCNYKRTPVSPHGVQKCILTAATPCHSHILILPSSHWEPTRRGIQCSTRMWRLLHKQTLGHYFCWAGQISSVFLWWCWTLPDLAGKLFSKNHVMGMVHINPSNQEVFGGCVYRCLVLQHPADPTAGQGQRGSWLRVSSAAVTTHTQHCHSGCGRRSAGSSCEHSTASLQQYLLGLLPTPGLQTPPCCDFLSSAQDCVAAEFNPLLYQNRNASVNKVVMPNLGHIHPLLHF